MTDTPNPDREHITRAPMISTPMGLVEPCRRLLDVPGLGLFECQLPAQHRGHCEAVTKVEGV